MYQAVRELEADWRAGRPRPIEDYLPRADADDSSLCADLILCDLEWQWRSKAATSRQNVSAQDRLKNRLFIEDYLKAVGYQPTPPHLSKLVLGEYRVRQIWGDEPLHAEYQRRFPGDYASFQAALHEAPYKLSSLAINIQYGGSQVFATSLDKPLQFGRQQEGDPLPYSRVTDTGFDRIIMGRRDERQMSRNSLRLELASKTQLNVSNLSTFQAVTINSISELEPGGTTSLQPPASLLLMGRLITVAEGDGWQGGA